MISPAASEAARVDALDRLLQEGRPLAFDNSDLHRAWNDGPESRVVLSAYVLHPGLTAVERAAIAFLVGSFPDVAAVNRVFDAPTG